LVIDKEKAPTMKGLVILEKVQEILPENPTEVEEMMIEIPGTELATESEEESQEIIMAETEFPEITKEAKIRSQEILTVS